MNNGTRNFVLRLLINAIALMLAAELLPGIIIETDFVSVLIVALIFSVVNALVKPLLVLLTCPAVILTLGLFILVINGLLLQLTAYLAGSNLTVEGFWPAFFGGIIMSLTNMILEGLLNIDDPDEYEDGSQPRKRK